MQLYDPTANKSVENLDKVPADFRPMYKEADGKYVLDEENGVVKASLNILGSVKGALSKARKDADDAKAKQVDLSSLSEFGATPAEIKAKFDERVSELTASAKNGKDITESVKKAVSAEWQGKVTKSEEKASKLVAQLDRVLKIGTATAAIAKHKASIKGLMPLVTSQLKSVLTDDNEYSVQVVDSAGAPRYNGTGGLMTIEELVEEIKADKEFAGHFPSEAANGGGAKPGTQQTRTQQSAAAAAAANGELSPIQMISRGLAKKQFVSAK